MELHHRCLLQDLAPEVLSYAFAWLGPREVLLTEVACKRVRTMLAMDPAALVGVLAHSFNLPYRPLPGRAFAASRGHAQLKALCRRLLRDPIAPLPFAGALTDGGVDRDPGAHSHGERYSFVPLFRPTVWDPHCSAAPPPLHVVGALLDEEPAAWGGREAEAKQRFGMAGSLAELSRFLGVFGAQDDGLPVSLASATLLLETMSTDILRSIFVQVAGEGALRPILRRDYGAMQRGSPDQAPGVTFSEFVQQVAVAHAHDLSAEGGHGSDDDDEDDDGSGGEGNSDGDVWEDVADGDGDEEDEKVGKSGGAAEAAGGGGGGASDEAPSLHRRRLRPEWHPADGKQRLVQWVPDLLVGPRDPGVAASVARVSVSRRGEFSCPVRSGALFVSRRPRCDALPPGPLLEPRAPRVPEGAPGTRRSVWGPRPAVEASVVPAGWAAALDALCADPPSFADPRRGHGCPPWLSGLGHFPGLVTAGGERGGGGGGGGEEPVAEALPASLPRVVRWQRSGAGDAVEFEPQALAQEGDAWELVLWFRFADLGPLSGFPPEALLQVGSSLKVGSGQGVPRAREVEWFVVAILGHRYIILNQLFLVPCADRWTWR